MTTDATPAALRLIDVLGPLVDKWAADEYVQFTNRSSGRRTTTTVSRDALLLLVDRAVAAERERQCAAIKAADDKASEGDYMLDSDDCISVIRGTWNPGA